VVGECGGGEMVLRSLFELLKADVNQSGLRQSRRGRGIREELLERGGGREKQRKDFRQIDRSGIKKNRKK